MFRISFVFKMALYKKTTKTAFSILDHFVSDPIWPHLPLDWANVHALKGYALSTSAQGTREGVKECQPSRYCIKLLASPHKDQVHCYSTTLMECHVVVNACEGTKCSKIYFFYARQKKHLSHPLNLLNLLGNGELLPKHQTKPPPKQTNALPNPSHTYTYM